RNHVQDGRGGREVRAPGRMGAGARAASAVPAHQRQRHRAVQGHIDPGRGDAAGIQIRRRDLPLREGEVREDLMLCRRIMIAGAALARLACGATAVAAKDTKKTSKIGAIYDYTAPLAAGGSELHALGTKIMIDYFNAHGGVAGYKIEPIYAD